MSTRPTRLITALPLLIVVVMLAMLPNHGHSQESSSWRWRDTGLATPPAFRPLCFDTTRPGIFIYPGDTNAPATVYDWQTGATTRLPYRSLARCGPNGLLYASDPAGHIHRFSLDDLEGQVIERLPTIIAQDSTSQVYALIPPEYDLTVGGPPQRGTGGTLWYSPDGGLSWQERAPPADTQIEQIVLSPTDARVVYAKAVYSRERRHVALPISTRLALFLSYDTGRTWEKRCEPGEENFCSSSMHLKPMSGGNMPVGVLQGMVNPPVIHPTVSLLVSGDKASTFIKAGDDRKTDLVHSRTAILRSTPQAPGTETWLFSLAPEHNDRWKPLPHPRLPAGTKQLNLTATPAAPDNLVLWPTICCDLADTSPVWYSPDGGAMWQHIGDMDNIVGLTPYLPLTILGNKDGQLYALTLPSADQSITWPVSINGAPDSLYIARTGHNIQEPFRRYWMGNEGRTRFGLPITEAFREYLPDDGRVHLVQYFEQPRLAYHQGKEQTRLEYHLDHKRVSGVVRASSLE